MIKMVSAVTPSALVLSAGAALADPADSWGNGFGHMMWGGGFGMAGGLMMLLFWGGDHRIDRVGRPRVLGRVPLRRQIRRGRDSSRTLCQR